jgi:FixJ family two-component response regulator
MAEDFVCFWIIDDDLSFGKSLQRILHARGFRAESFGSAQSFLDSVPSGERGYAIVDIHMPDCDGFVLMKKMQDLHYGMPVIMVTAQEHTFAKALALQQGAAGYFQKPFSVESLLELVHKMEADKPAP